LPGKNIIDDFLFPRARPIMVWSKPRGKSINKRGIPAETKPGHKLYGSRKREDMTGIRSRPTTMGKGNGIRTFQGWWCCPRAPLNRIRIEVALPPIYLSMYLPHNLALLTRNWIWLGNCVFCHWWMVVSRLLANCIARFSFPFVAKMPSIQNGINYKYSSSRTVIGISAAKGEKRIFKRRKVVGLRKM